MRQGATALEVALPESAERLLARFTALLDRVEGELEAGGGELLEVVTAFVEAEGEGLREDTVAVRQALEAMEPVERRAMEERLGEAFLEANRRWHGLRQRIAREYVEDANAIFQRVIQLNPAA
ncbi:MAG: hypothetical protein EA398_12780 [Deltaproteobacteria bacterium]|nr:MAG: hypothetical protein EA398_12780 [Deltaproteobacteria bacterium]